MFQRKKRQSLEHIATALVPPAAFTAVPHTPPPTPPPSRTKKKFLRRKKKSPSPSPILPALLGVNLSARAIGLNLGDTSSTRTSPDRSFYMRDVSLSSQEDFEEYSSLPARGRVRRRQRDNDSREMVVEAEIQQKAAPDLREGRPLDAYDGLEMTGEHSDPTGRNHRRGPRKKKKRTPRSTDNSLELSDAQELREKQQQLEDKVELQNHETREMVHDVMARQSVIEGSQRGSEMSYDAEEFEMDHQALINENSRLIKKNKGLVEQNRHLHSVAEVLKRHGKKGSPRSQVEAIIDENDILRVTIHRLNTELAKFQEKYGEHPRKRKSRRAGSASPEPEPKWLTDVEYLSPLFISYDNQLKEKDGLIQSLKGQGTQDQDTMKKCNNLSEQNSLMVEEIQVLMEQIESLKQKAYDTNKDHAREVAKLSKALAIAEAESEVTSEEVGKLKEELTSLKRVNEKLVMESADKISAKEHVAAVNELKKEIDDIKEFNEKELRELMRKIKATEEEKSSLALENTDNKAKNKQLQGQLDALTKAYDNLKDKCAMLTSELEDTDKRNAECEAHLAEVIRLAEKTSAERDALAALAEKEQKVAEQALRKTMLGKWEMGKMEQTVNQYKRQAASQMNDISDKIRGLEESHQGRLQEHHREISHLRRVLQSKQVMLDDVTEEKKQVENELENVWQAATSENRRIMDSLYKSKVLD